MQAQRQTRFSTPWTLQLRSLLDHIQDGFIQMPEHEVPTAPPPGFDQYVRLILQGSFAGTFHVENLFEDDNVVNRLVDYKLNHLQALIHALDDTMPYELDLREYNATIAAYPEDQPTTVLLSVFSNRSLIFEAGREMGEQVQFVLEAYLDRFYEATVTRVDWCEDPSPYLDMTQREGLPF